MVAIILASQEGALGRIDWTALAYTPTEGYSAYVDFIISTDGTANGDFGSGLDSDSIYPSSGVTAGNTLTIKYDSADIVSRRTHLILSYGSLVTAIPLIINLPLIAVEANKKFSIANLYSKRSSDGAIFTTGAISIEGLSNTVASSVDPASPTGTDTFLSQPNSALISSFQFTTPTIPLVTPSTGVIGVAFDHGFSFT